MLQGIEVPASVQRWINVGIQCDIAIGNPAGVNGQAPQFLALDVQLVNWDETAVKQRISRFVTTDVPTYGYAVNGVYKQTVVGKLPKEGSVFQLVRENDGEVYTTPFDVDVGELELGIGLQTNVFVEMEHDSIQLVTGKTPDEVNDHVLETIH